jgi:hypothetical protein
MNQALERRWRDRLAPFNGVTLVAPPAPLAATRRLLAAITGRLRPVDLSAEDQLFTFEDWHDHDGYLTSERAATWDELGACLATDDALVSASSDDTLVRRAWYPNDFAFLLRWCVTSDPDDFGLPRDGFAGWVDVTGSPEQIQSLSDLVLGGDVRPAGDFFDATWSG